MLLHKPPGVYKPRTSAIIKMLHKEKAEYPLFKFTKGIMFMVQLASSTVVEKEKFL
jgi:hypothetical protein